MSPSRFPKKHLKKIEVDNGYQDKSKYAYCEAGKMKSYKGSRSIIINPEMKDSNSIGDYKYNRDKTIIDTKYEKGPLYGS